MLNKYLLSTDTRWLKSALFYILTKFSPLAAPEMSNVNFMCSLLRKFGQNVISASMKSPLIFTGLPNLTVGGFNGCMERFCCKKKNPPITTTNNKWTKRLSVWPSDLSETYSFVISLRRWYVTKFYSLCTLVKTASWLLIFRCLFGSRTPIVTTFRLTQTSWRISGPVPTSVMATQ